MDHNSAIENHTAERYLMGELNEAERDAYEEHFFCCAACADEIKSANEFMESARQVVHDELKSEIYSHVAHRSIWGSWLNWRSMLQPIPAMACVLLVAVTGFTGYQNSVTIPRLANMASVHLVSQDAILALLTVAHGDADDANNLPSNKALHLRFAIPGPADRADIITDSGIRKFSIDISKQRPEELVNLWLDAGVLQPGKYFVVIQAAIKGELARFAFGIVK